MSERRARRTEQTEWQLLQGLAANAGAWAIMAFVFHLPTVAVWWWGFGVATHALTVTGKLVARRREARAALPEASRSGEALEAGRAPEALPAADPFLAELEGAVAALESAARPAGLPRGVDLAALRSAAAELRRQHLELEALADGTARERLSRERDEAEAGAALAGDPRTAEVLREQARSVVARLAALEQAAGAAARLGARERTLLHQIEALRLSLLQTGLDERRTPDLAGEIQRLQLDLRANAEIEADLARARLGTRLQRT